MESTVLAEAFSHLDPSSRALLHVSLHHRVPDERLARVLRTDLHQIEVRRTAALDQLAGELELNGDDPGGAAQAELERLDDDAWATLTAGLSSRAAPAGHAHPGAAGHRPGARARGSNRSRTGTGTGTGAESRSPSRWRSRPRRRRRPLPLRRRGHAGAAAAPWPPSSPPLLAAGVVVLVLALTGGDDKTGAKPAAKTTPPPSAPAPAAAAAPTPPPVALAPAPGARTAATGTARIVDVNGRPELELVAHLPRSRDAYEAWLFNSIADAVPLGRIPPSGRLRVPLPASYRSYRVLDISREPPDGNPNHSGLSVQRVRIGQLVSAS